MDWRCRPAMIVLFGLFLTTASAQTAEIPFRSPRYAVTIEQREVADVLKDFAADQGINIDIPDTLTSTISGRYDASPLEFLDQITQTNGLVYYFDGTKLHISPSREVTTQVYQVQRAEPQAIIDTLKQIGIYSDRFPIKIVSEYGLLYVPGPPRYQELVNLTLNTLEAAAATGAQTRLSTRVYRLKYAWSDDQLVQFRQTQIVLPGLATVLRGLVFGLPVPGTFGGTAGFGGGVGAVGGGFGGGFGGGGNGPLAARDLQGLRGAGVRRFNPGVGPLALPPSTAAFSGYPAYGASGYGLAPYVAPLVPGQPVPVPSEITEEALEAAALTLGPVSIISDRRLNAVIIQDLPSRFPAYDKLIAELDVPMGLVEIEATIVDIDRDSSFVLGPPFSSTWERSGGTRSASLNVVPGDIANVAFTLLKDSAVQFNLQLQALQEEGHAEIVSQPTVLTLNNIEAQLDNTQTFFVRVAGFEQVDLFDVVVGTSLRVTPHIVDEPSGRKIQLIVQVEDGARDASEQNVDDIPQVQRSTINTQALLNEEESLLVGGLVRTETRYREQGIPGLKDIPKIGFLFGKTQTSTFKTQRYILIKPRIVELPQSMYGCQDDLDSDVQILPWTPDTMTPDTMTPDTMTPSGPVTIPGPQLPIEQLPPPDYAQPTDGVPVGRLPWETIRVVDPPSLTLVPHMDGDGLFGDLPSQAQVLAEQPTGPQVRR